MRDPLYVIFEKHLMSAFVEDEAMDEFLTAVVTAYMGHLRSEGTIIPTSHASIIETDLREEVMEMYRKKTYGHFNLAEFRRAKGVQVDEAIVPASQPKAGKEKARRNGRAS